MKETCRLKRGTPIVETPLKKENEVYGLNAYNLFCGTFSKTNRSEQVVCPCARINLDCVLFTPGGILTVLFY